MRNDDGVCHYMVSTIGFIMQHTMCWKNLLWKQLVEEVQGISATFITSAGETNFTESRGQDASGANALSERGKCRYLDAPCYSLFQTEKSSHVEYVTVLVCWCYHEVIQDCITPWHYVRCRFRCLRDVISHRSSVVQHKEVLA